MGTLYLVATPIGNLEDITLRALRVLREVSLIAAEDTRHTRKLLNHFDIPTRAISYHEHSPDARRDLIVAALATGDVALVSDAGMPAISDPGVDLVRAALAAGHPVVPIPGPVAAISALAASGMATDTFIFLGFPPRKSAERRGLLERVRAEARTLVLYEAPHRLLECLDDLRDVLGDREIAVARELTKLHEEWLRGPISAVRERAAAGAGPRGEYTLVVAGATAGEERPGEPNERDGRPAEEVARERLRALLRDGVRTGEAAARVAKEFHLPKRVAYRFALDIATEASE